MIDLSMSSKYRPYAIHEYLESLYDKLKKHHESERTSFDIFCIVKNTDSLITDHFIARNYHFLVINKHDEIYN